MLWGLLALFVPAFWQSMETTLPEPIAAGLLLLAYLAWLKGRWLLAGGLLAASLLVRETGLVFVAVLAATMVLRGERRQAFAMAAIAVAPFALWHLYVGWVSVAGMGTPGLLLQAGAHGRPVRRLLSSMWSHVRAGQYEMDLARGDDGAADLLTVAWILAVAAAVVRRSALTVAAAIYATIAVSLNYGMVWVHTRNGERVTYETFILLALCSSCLFSRSWIWRVGIGSFWALAGYYVFWVGFDAEFYRQTLLSPIW